MFCGFQLWSRKWKRTFTALRGPKAHRYKQHKRELNKQLFFYVQRECSNQTASTRNSLITELNLVSIKRIDKIFNFPYLLYYQLQENIIENWEYFVSKK